MLFLDHRFAEAAAVFVFCLCFSLLGVFITLPASQKEEHDAKDHDRHAQKLYYVQLRSKRG